MGKRGSCWHRRSDGCGNGYPRLWTDKNSDQHGGWCEHQMKPCILLLLHLLRSGDGGMKKREREKRREQHTQQSPTPGHRVSPSNYRHGMGLLLDTPVEEFDYGDIFDAQNTARGGIRARKRAPL